MQEALRKRMEELARARANDFTTKTGYNCPRDIKDPGLWFGFMCGFAACYEIFEKELKNNKGNECCLILKEEILGDKKSSSFAEQTAALFFKNDDDTPL